MPPRDELKEEGGWGRRYRTAAFARTTTSTGIDAARVSAWPVIVRLFHRLHTDTGVDEVALSECPVKAVHFLGPDHGV